MLPIQIERRFANPGELQKEFLSYLKASNAPINQSKSIASNILYHAKDISTLNSSTFFSGTFIATDTNIVGNFVRPESEHFLIYAIRMYTGVDLASVSLQKWERGINSGLSGAMFNSKFSIDVNSVRLLKNMPITEFEKEITTKDKGTLFLDEPILWQGQTEMKLTISAPDGVTYAATTFVRFDCVGLGLI